MEKMSKQEYCACAVDGQSGGYVGHSHMQRNSVDDRTALSPMFTVNVTEESAAILSSGTRFFPAGRKCRDLTEYEQEQEQEQKQEQHRQQE